MPPEVLARAFEPFFTTKDIGKGSGLGLPQVYGFAQQSGGRVTIDSEVGVGTIVTLLVASLVAAAGCGDADDASSVAPARSDARGGQVLLVEDDNEVAALTREMLSSFGFTVIHVASPGRRARRAGRMRARSTRVVRHHDARWHQRPRAGSRDPATAPGPAHRADHRLCRSRRPAWTMGEFGVLLKPYSNTSQTVVVLEADHLDRMGYRTRYSSVNSATHSRSTMCQYKPPHSMSSMSRCALHCDFDFARIHASTPRPIRRCSRCMPVST